MPCCGRVSRRSGVLCHGRVAGARVIEFKLRVGELNLFEVKRYLARHQMQ
jgi:hypothetical protein